ncbi:hypothetical protein [Halobaculum marinum]|uniref:Uncharacterized protein n=1 Tax=Halobaculum marinum TaxID=3031996 RepID=A0ABD5X4Q0_9EURY|nr:hypothetical protein [Halobaculum sp. DT55]
MTSIRAVAVAALAACAALPSTALAHVGHQTPTPSGPLAGVSPVGQGVGLAGLLVLTGVLLLGQEEVLTERARSVGVGVGAALLVAGVALGLFLP